MPAPSPTAPRGRAAALLPGAGLLALALLVTAVLRDGGGAGAAGGPAAAGAAEPVAGAPLLAAGLAAPQPALAAPPRPGAGPADDGPPARELTPALEAAGVTALDLQGPHDPPADRFHPDGRAEPALGGRVIVHLEAEPRSLNAALRNDGFMRWMLVDLHASLLTFDPVSWEYEGDLAERWDVEDTLVLAGGRDAEGGNILFGRVEEGPDGYVVTSGSSSNPIERTVVPREQVESLQRGTVYTFHLRPGVLWHDGHPFDEQDVAFSLGIYDNPVVDCDSKRYKYSFMARHEVVAPMVVRVFWSEQYFGIEGAFGLDLAILPRHVYDLTDPDNPRHDGAPLADAEALQRAQGEAINTHPANTTAFVGLGPYRLVGWSPGQSIDAERFEGYWDKDPARAGYVDSVRWRIIRDDGAAFSALLNNEIDVFGRLSSEDFFGAATQNEAFTAGHYKAFTYTGILNYLGWNCRQSHLSDPRVRRALSQAFDVAGWRDRHYHGYAIWTTSSFHYFGPAYDPAVQGYPYDPAAAEELLAEAGWYDRDGNGLVDKDGRDLVVEALMPTGNKASEVMLQAIQAAYARVGVRLEIRPLEWGTMSERILDREFDACHRAWTNPTPETDPFQVWHSSNATGRAENVLGFTDELADALIEEGRVELDDQRRWALWRRLHARIYELQPVLFGWCVPRKLAFSRALHGVKLYKFDPGYRLRDLHYAAGTPGTRPLPGR